MEEEYYDNDEDSTGSGSSIRGGQPHPASPGGGGGSRKIWVIVGIVLICLIGCCGAGIASLLGIIKAGTSGVQKADHFKTALSIAESHPEFITEVGQPVSVGAWMGFSVKYNAGESTAEVRSAKLKGPNGEATMSYSANFGNGPPIYQTLDVVLPSGKTLNLKPATPSAP